MSSNGVDGNQASRSEALNEPTEDDVPHISRSAERQTLSRSGRNAGNARERRISSIDNDGNMEDGSRRGSTLQTAGRIMRSVGSNVNNTPRSDVPDSGTNNRETTRSHQAMDH